MTLHSIPKAKGGLSHANIERDIYLFPMVDVNRNICKMLLVAI